MNERYIVARSSEHILFVYIFISFFVDLFLFARFAPKQLGFTFVTVITNQSFKAGLRIATWVMPFHLTISHTSKPSFL